MGDYDVGDATGVPRRALAALYDNPAAVLKRFIDGPEARSAIFGLDFGRPLLYNYD